MGGKQVADKWILYKHTSSYEIIRQLALDLKFSNSKLLDKDARLAFLEQLREKGLYSPRNPDNRLDSATHRINTLLYFGFGYREARGGESKRFIFSPLGNLFIKYIEDESKLPFITLSMLWSKQFPDPFFGTLPKYKIYPFRIIYRLLSDPRLEFKLSSIEYAVAVCRLTEPSDSKYEELVIEIEKVRAWGFNEMEFEFKSNEHHYVNAVHEWDYTTRLLSRLGLLVKSEGQKLFQLNHGTSTKRWTSKYWVSIPVALKPFLGKLAASDPANTFPIELNDPERLKRDAIQEIYSFCPEVLLQELGEVDQAQAFQLASLPKLIKKFAINQAPGDPDRFEIELTNAMNLFRDVVAERISGPGNTDVECLYLEDLTKFALEAKSTQTKLTGLNAGRLALHRTKISAKYTLVVAPNYSPSVLTDIKGTDVVIVLVNTLAEFLYNALAQDKGEMSYQEIHQIITSNLGSDVSAEISELTLKKFAASIENMGKID